jgi:hypothetical protein
MPPPEFIPLRNVKAIIKTISIFFSLVGLPKIFQS